MTKLKTVKKWEVENKIKLKWILQNDGKVSEVCCVVCKEFESQIMSSKNFSDSWIKGSKNPSSDSVKKHVSSEMHKRAADLALKKELGPKEYNENIYNNTSIGRSLTRMHEETKKVMKNRFATAYYLAKKEKPFTDFPDLLDLQEINGLEVKKGYRTDRAAACFVDYIAESMKIPLKECLLKARYYSILQDGSTDTSVKEQEIIYVLFLHEGRPILKFLSIENPDVADAKHLVECVKEAFHRFGITEFHSHLSGLNVDGASVNLGIHKGVATLLRDASPWLIAVHCFNHRVELASKDAFGNSFFEDIDKMLVFLYYLYQKSSKRLQALKELGVALGENVPKPVKASGTRWIAHRYNAMKVILKHYGIYMTHLEELANNDSSSEKRAEIKGFLKKWDHAKYPIHIAVYLDVLSILVRMSLSEQKDLHDPVKAVGRIQDFNWTMAKLQMYIDGALDKGQMEETERSRLTHYNKFRSEVTSNDSGYVYQDRTLKAFEASEGTVRKVYKETISSLSTAIMGRFDNLATCPVFKNLVQILNCAKWPKKKEDLLHFGDEEINELVDHFKVLLEKNGCVIENVPAEWDILKNKLFQTLSPNQSYLDVWSNVFKNDEFNTECQNILHIIELLLITPYSNAKLERMFSAMGRVKTDWRNRLGRDRLDASLRIKEEGCPIADYCPDTAIDIWFRSKNRRMNTSSHKYPKKRKTAASSSKDVIDITELTMSDLENDEDFE